MPLSLYSWAPAAAHPTESSRNDIGEIAGCGEVPHLLMTATSVTSVTSSELEESSSLRAALLALNNEHAVELSWADDAKLRNLVAMAFLAERAGFADAFLIALDQMLVTTTPTFVGFAVATVGLYTSTGWSQRRKRAGGDWRARCTAA